MKHLLLTTALLLAAVATQAQVQFEWGTASWNIENGRVYENIDDYNADPATLMFPNPTGYTLTFFNIVAVSYDVFIDGSTEAIHTASSKQMGCDVPLTYDFIEGHDYRIVVNEAVLCQANIATRTTDTLSTCTDQYTISFRINGPEIVNEYNYEATMSLAIIDQEAELTFSEVDLASICKDLGINDITEAKLIGLNANGSYNKAFTSPDYGYDFFDGWRDADGGYTVWGGGAGGGAYDLVGGHNPYPAVYCIKWNETCDTIKYYFYEYWRDYDPNDSGEIPGPGTEIVSVKRQAAPLRAPETSYNSVVMTFVNEDGTTTQLVRNYRVNPGCDYSANFIFKTEQKAVRVHATMHFVASEYDPVIDGIASANKASRQDKRIFGLSGARQQSLKKGLNIVIDETGTARKILVR